MDRSGPAGLVEHYVQKAQQTRSRHRSGYRENLQPLAIKNGSVGRSIGPPSVHAHAHRAGLCAPEVIFLRRKGPLLYHSVENLQRAVTDVPEWSPVALSVLLHRLAEATGASGGEGGCSVGCAVPAALCESVVALGGCAWHVVALRAPMPAWGMVGILQIAHHALVLGLISAAGVNVKLKSADDMPKDLMRIVFGPAY